MNITCKSLYLTLTLFKGFEILHRLYPSWSPFAWDSETCAVCAVQVYNSKEDRLELRKKAEKEKARIELVKDAVQEEEDNAMAQMMGFGGFGSTKR